MPIDLEAHAEEKGKAEFHARMMRFDSAKRNLAECLNAAVAIAMQGAINAAIERAKEQSKKVGVAPTLSAEDLETAFAGININVGLPVQVAVAAADLLLVRLGWTQPTQEMIADQVQHLKDTGQDGASERERHSTGGLLGANGRPVGDTDHLSIGG